MRINLSMFALLLAVSVPPVAAQNPSGPAPAESAQPHSMVSVMVDPALNDGRLVIKIAAKNLGDAPISFGPSSVSIAKANGEAVAISPLSSLIDDVRMAAGMPAAATPAAAPTQGAYASPQLNQRDGGRMDVTGFTGGSAVGGDEYVRRSRSKTGKPTISEAEAQQQIAALSHAILKDSTLSPGQIVAGQLVSQTLKFDKKEDRTLHVRVRIAGDEHGFTIEAPAE